MGSQYTAQLCVARKLPTQAVAAVLANVFSLSFVLHGNTPAQSERRGTQAAALAFTGDAAAALDEFSKPLWQALGGAGGGEAALQAALEALPAAYRPRVMLDVDAAAFVAPEGM
eukprot:COSAG06_NODE_10025_length_1766_cov_2.126575_2_plen_114_part_00